MLKTCGRNLSMSAGEVSFCLGEPSEVEPLSRTTPSIMWLRFPTLSDGSITQQCRYLQKAIKRNRRESRCHISRVWSKEHNKWTNVLMHPAFDCDLLFLMYLMLMQAKTTVYQVLLYSINNLNLTWLETPCLMTCLCLFHVFMFLSW